MSENPEAESPTVEATVIAITAFGATLRLGSGELASAPLADVEANRTAYERAHASRKVLRFERRAAGKRAVFALVPNVSDAELDERIAEYLRETEEWEKPGAPPAHERHFLRKKKCSELFEKRDAARETRGNTT